MTQTVCGRDGDRLHCSDGRSYRIYPEPWSRSGRLRPAEPRGEEETRSPAIGEGAPLSGPPRLYGPDGLVCWPHGDHAHCTARRGVDAPRVQ
jgi:hypothetical protein